MKKILICLTLLLATGAIAHAGTIGDFLASTNQFGYQGTISNTTEGLGPFEFPTPRDGVVYFTNNVPLAGYSEYGNWNQILSTWYQHPTSNQNPGFFQISDGDNDGNLQSSVFTTVTSATGGWTQNGAVWDFSLTVTGAGANCDNSVARLWQPDAGHAWCGTYSEYSYTISATGMDTYILDGWRYNSTNPTGITGSFDGTFHSTQAVFGGATDLDGDWYTVHLDFSNASWDSTGWSDSYDGAYYGKYSDFGAPVPEPGTLFLLGAGLSALVLYRRKIHQ